MKIKKISKSFQKHAKPSGRKVFPQFTGKVQMTREGYIFVIIDGQDDDVFVKASKTRRALNGDIVRVAVTRESDHGKRREGEVVEIVERSKAPFVGILHYVGAQAWVLMQGKNMPYDITVDAEQARAMGAEQGMKVAAVVDRWDRGENEPSGHLTDVLGMPGANETEMHAILAEYNLPYRFEPEVENAAEGISEKIGAAELKGRKDFRKTLTFTIDPADAKDFDDAISFKPLDNGNYEVGVHIADVSYYVKPGSVVDKEARNRGTSVYLVDRTVPMLPEKLCNKLCSLRPNEDKLTFSAVFEISPKADIKSRWIGRTVICSDYRFDYDQAQEIIEAGKTRSDIETAIVSLNAIAAILKQKRRKLGAIDFDRPEMKVEVDETGKPVRVYQKRSKEANWLIEEFMLLANRTVAEFIGTGGQMNGVAQKNAKTFVYRVHDEPNEIKLEGLRVFARGFGYKMDGDISGGKRAAEALDELLASSAGKPEHEAFANLALRAMAKAVYSTDNIGHYGLAFKFYTHFTSPIRRYPDLMVHRLLAMYQDGAASQKKDKFEEERAYEHQIQARGVHAGQDRPRVRRSHIRRHRVGNVRGDRRDPHRGYGYAARNEVGLLRIRRGALLRDRPPHPQDIPPRGPREDQGEGRQPGDAHARLRAHRARTHPGRIGSGSLQALFLFRIGGRRRQEAKALAPGPFRQGLIPPRRQPET